MTLTLPAAHHLMRQDRDSDPLSRGETNGGSLTHNTKSAGSLPVNAANAMASTNNSGSSATGNPAFAHHAFLSSGGYDVSTDTKVLIFTYQCNAANRIQVSTLANDGFCFRIGSGTGSPPTNYKHYQIGGRDTPLGRQNAGIRAIIIDLNDTSHETQGGTFDNTDVQTYALGTVRHNISGGSSNWYFRQPAFLFDTAKNATNIPKFTGIGCNFDEFIDAVLGTDAFDIIGYDWVSRNGNVLYIASPMQIGDNTTATTFTDSNKTILSPVSDDPADPRNRLTTQAMRLYRHPRNNAGDTLSWTNITFIRGTAAPRDLDVSNNATATISYCIFQGMGDMTIGSSVECDTCIFTLASGTRLIVNGASIDGSTVNGDMELNSETDLTNVIITGDVYINTGAHSTVTFANVTVGGNVYNNDASHTLTINGTDGSNLVSGDPGVGNGQTEIKNTRTLTITGIVSGSEVRIFDAPEGGNELGGQEDVLSGTFVHTYDYSADTTAYVQIWKEGYIFNANNMLQVTLGSNSASIPVVQSIDRNYLNP